MTPAALYLALTTQWTGAPEEILVEATGEALDLDACMRARNLVEYLAAVYSRTRDPLTADLIAYLVVPPFIVEPASEPATTAWSRLMGPEDTV